jgi:hypothetical protein
MPEPTTPPPPPPAAFVAFVAFHTALGHVANEATWTALPPEMRAAWTCASVAVALYGSKGRTS